MSESTPVLTLDGPLAVITLNRPTHRHRLHAADLVVLKDHLSRIDADPAIRVAVLQSDATAANGVFCAGYHIGEHGAEADDATFAQIVDMLEDLRPPTLCALSGDVYGGATDLVLACDFTIAVDTVRMRMPAAALGLHYYPSGIVRYVSRLGVLQASAHFSRRPISKRTSCWRSGTSKRLPKPTDWRKRSPRWLHGSCNSHPWPYSS